jgi:hypothetical protein
MLRLVLITLLAFLSMFFTGCDDNEIPALRIPLEYDGTAFQANTITETSIVNQLSALVTEIKKGRNGTVLNINTLTSLYAIGNPSLKSQNTYYYSLRLEGSLEWKGWLKSITDASGGTYTPGSPTGNGGTYGGYLFDENGLEPEQMIEKGQFGSVLYNRVSELLSINVDETTADRVLALIGGNPTFPNSNDVTKHSNPDKAFIVYAARRDKNDGKGFYSDLKSNLIKLQASVIAGTNYKKQQEEAAAEILHTLEKVNAATIINYCYSATATLSKTPSELTDAMKAGALHSYSEAVGFIHGYKTIDQQKKIIKDSQIDEILMLLNAPSDAAHTSYKFITNPETELPKLLQVVTKLQSIYGFTNQQLEEFKKNWVAEQNR